jgi:hypothetical protein
LGVYNLDRKKDYSEAIVYFTNAEAYSEASEDKIKAIFNIGKVHEESQDFEKAKEFY